MKQKPILFSAPMVRAILEGRKTQTRRIIKPQPECFSHEDWPDQPGFKPHFNDDGSLCCGVCMGKQQRLTKRDVTGIRNPYGAPSDRLWVKETHAFYSLNFNNTGKWHPSDPDLCAHFKAGAPWEVEDRIERWRPSIHMPRWASRITLEVESVRVERLQEISEDDAKAEGVESLDAERSMFDRSICPTCGGTRLYTAFSGEGGAMPDTDCADCDTHKKRYRHLWESINGPGSFAINPWVWVLSFKRI